MSPDSNELAPPILVAPRLGYVLVAEEPEFIAALSQLGDADELTIDAERASGFRYGNSAYLLQVGSQNSANLIFDPVALSSVVNWNSRLAGVLAKKLWILHAATQDLPCLAELEIYPQYLFDTELAARLCGIKRFGLASLAEDLLGFRIAKEHSSADWSLRPLTEKMLNYAAIDVEVLFEIRERLQERLLELNREHWAQQEFRNLLSFKPKVAEANGWRRMSGAGTLKALTQQQIAASLWQTRDERARHLDVAPGRLIPDSAIVVAAANEPKTIGQLSRMREFSGRESRSQIQLWWQAIQNAPQFNVETAPTLEIPPHRIWERKYPEAWERYQAMRVALQPIVTELDIPAENLISPNIVRELAWNPGEVVTRLAASGARQWQIELVEVALSDALQQLT